jgi:hypothetical protein
MPDRIVALGLLRNLYKDSEACTTVGNMGEFSLSDSHFLRRGNHIIDSFGENIRRVVVVRAFSSGAVESWSNGCTHPASPGAEAHEVGARG